MVAEYREAKKVQGVTEGTLYEIALSLRNFERLAGKCNSKQITQSIIDKFILQRGSEVKRPTLNKDIRNIKTFINWCRENRYLNENLKIKSNGSYFTPIVNLCQAQDREDWHDVRGSSCWLVWTIFWAIWTILCRRVKGARTCTLSP